MSNVNTVLTVVLVVLGGLMTFLIMLQEGKGGGLAALGGTKAAGIEGVTNPIRRATAYLAGIFFLLAIVLGVRHRPEQSVGAQTFPSESAAATAPETPAVAKTEKSPVVPAPAPAAPNAAAPAVNAPAQATPPAANAPAPAAAPAAPPAAAPAAPAPATEQKAAAPANPPPAPAANANENKPAPVAAPAAP